MLYVCYLCHNILKYFFNIYITHIFLITRWSRYQWPCSKCRSWYFYIFIYNLPMFSFLTRFRIWTYSIFFLRSTGIASVVVSCLFWGQSSNFTSWRTRPTPSSSWRRVEAAASSDGDRDGDRIPYSAIRRGPDTNRHKCHRSMYTDMPCTHTNTHIHTLYTSAYLYIDSLMKSGISAYL